MRRGVRLGWSLRRELDMIRRAAPADAQALSELAFRSKGYWGYSPEFMEACRAELSVSASDLERHPTFVLTGSGQFLGFYSLERLSQTHVELGHLFVEPSEIGSGHGRALMAHAQEQARRRGFRVLVIQGDPNALGFYEACGARRVGSQASSSIPGRWLPLLEIHLSGGETS
jgi:GNAT superfamily N-acetyltransferase